MFGERDPFCETPSSPFQKEWAETRSDCPGRSRRWSGEVVGAEEKELRRRGNLIGRHGRTGHPDHRHCPIIERDTLSSITALAIRRMIPF
jgi:hypothetical protein